MRIAALILVTLLLGCDRTVVEPDARPSFALNAAKPFVLELGRGSGLSGLDIVRVDETGLVRWSRNEGRRSPDVATFQLSSADLAAVVALVNANHLPALGRSYSDPRVMDGTQWVLSIEQPPSAKAIYFNNAFPEEIKAFADGLDALLAKASSGAATWSRVSPEAARAEQAALWARIESTK